ncbi:cytochrome P450 [Streptacidiphilus sp. MAP12-16]|uniref:cytochrome P450 n=1 Tax=Streptacidiphilus sp. MAP12-16 TaxID=3156300 RepID=UPI003518ABFD
MVNTVINLSDPELWSRSDLAELIDGARSAGPVQRTEATDDGPVWSVISYDIAAQVLKNPAVFSSEQGSLLGTGEGLTPAGAGKMMALCDPPRHRELRTPAMAAFSPGSARVAAPGINERARTLFDQALACSEVDLVDVVSALPLAVMCDLLDVPEGDREMVVRVCDQAFLGRTAEERRAGHQQLIPYLLYQVMQRRLDPGDDLISTMATHQVGGRLLPVEDIVLNLDNIVVGGVQTVRHTASMCLLTLARRPDLWRLLQDESVDMGGAVDELLRWTSVGLHTLRTATQDVELGGQQIRRGDRVVVWTWPANHDPAAFSQPHEIILDRSPNRHLALGLGAHYCIGAPLAKVELGALFSTAVERIAEIKLLGEPVYNRSLINFGLESFPVSLVAR